MSAITPVDIKGLDRETLTELVGQKGHKPYRATQLFEWMHARGARDLEAMSNVPKDLRDPEQVTLGGLQVDDVMRSKDGTRKMLLRTAAGDRLESVIIPMGTGRWTQCVSSQIGCKMGCDFCATAEMSVRKNLTSSEIVDQIYHARSLMAEEDMQVNNLVFMGMGEPLDNLDNVIPALRVLLDQKGAAFGQRRITVSTVGLVPKIPLLAESVPINLAVSLNATTDELRSKLMPINRKYNLAQLLQALRDFPMAPRRRIFVEYVMLGGVNDTDEDAKRLPQLLHGVRAKINLIPFNPYPGSRFVSPTEERVAYFLDKLHKAGIQTNIREPKGRDIEAACGMLDGAQPI